MITVFRISLLVLGLGMFLRYNSFLLRKNTIVLINGTVSAGFEDVAKVFRENFESGLEPGGSGSAFVAFYNGVKVVDLWGGYADYEAGQTWSENTITSAFSCTKGLAALCVAMLVEQGYLRYEEKVSQYWPEFAQNGKENITVQMLLNHEAGLPIVSQTLSIDLISNFDELGRVFAESSPIWKPGTARGYHMTVHSELASQLLYRVDPKHRTLGEFFRQEVAEPFDIDFFIGLPLEENYRTARCTMDNTIVGLMNAVLTTYKSRRLMWGIVTGSTFFTEVLNNCGDICNAGGFNNPYFRRLEKPSSHGIGTARALAKLYSIVLNNEKGFHGKYLLSRKFVKNIPSGWLPMHDLVLGYPTRFNYGFAVYPNKGSIDISFGHSGSGGQIALAHPTMNLTQAYLTKHRCFYSAGDDPRWTALSGALSKSVKKVQDSEN